MITADEFKAVYQTTGIYDDVLPPHYYNGAEDIDLVARLMAEHYGPPGPQPTLAIAEFGCGTGRITTVLAPYAHQLVAVDSSPTMLDTFRTRYPDAKTRCLDIRQGVTRMLDDGLAGGFDVVGAFWSLSYPLGECFEELTAEGIRPARDLTTAQEHAGHLIQDLLRLVAPGGHFLVLFFDSETREQRLVTRFWERVAPFPEGGRAYTRQLLLDELRAAEDRAEGWLTHTRRGGAAIAHSAAAARAWFNQLHLKNLPALVNDPEVQREIDTFIDNHTDPSGHVILPSGVHVIDFHATRDPHVLLPERS